MRSYNDTLVRKLEHRTEQLSEANRQLEIDIAARIASENALRESEARFRQLAENIDGVFWLSDAKDHTFHYVSPSFERVWGISADQLLQSPETFLEVVHRDDRAQVAASLVSYAEGSWDQTFRIVHQDGALRWLRARAFPVRDAAGVTHRVAGVARDVTELRALEEQLRQVHKMEAIGRLAGGVAHDFNNHLSVILSYASLVLLDLRPGDPARDDLEQIRAAGERASALVQQLLTFSRSRPAVPGVADVGEVVANLHRMLIRLVGDQISLTVRRVSGEARVAADRGHLEQIVINLAVNARDAMSGRGALSIETSEVLLSPEDCAILAGTSPGPHICLRVTDNGTGIDEAIRERIFEPFFTTKSEGMGTGLGLATVFGIVQRCRGHVAVTSTIGVGTTFSVYLPQPTAAATAMLLVAPPPLTIRGSESVLLVEHDDQMRALCTAVLKRNGYTVLSALNGDDAIAVAAGIEGNVDALLISVSPPGRSAHEVDQALRARWPTLALVCMADHIVDASDNNADNVVYVMKPITPVPLVTALRRALDARVSHIGNRSAKAQSAKEDALLTIENC